MAIQQFDTIIVNNIAIRYHSSAALDARYFGQPDASGLIEYADPNSEGVLGAILTATGDANESIPLVSEGKATVYMDTTLAEGNSVKVGSNGRATLWSSSQTEISAAAAVVGAAASVTQPTAGVLTVHQVANVPGDQEKVIRVVGTEETTGDDIYEDFILDDTDTTVVKTGALAFETVSGAYVVDGSDLGAEDVLIRDIDPKTVITIGNGTNHLAAPEPVDTLEAYANRVDVTGPDTDATFVTVVGYTCVDPDDITIERVELDADSPSKALTAGPYRQILRICMGEATNAQDFYVRTDPAVDRAGRYCGRVITGGTYDNLGAVQVKA